MKRYVLIRFGALVCYMISIDKHDLPRSGHSFKYDNIHLDRIVPIESTDALCCDSSLVPSPRSTYLLNMLTS